MSATATGPLRYHPRILAGEWNIVHRVNSHHDVRIASFTTLASAEAYCANHPHPGQRWEIVHWSMGEG